MKIVFAGTPEFAVPSLQALVENGYDVSVVITSEDKPVGRKGVLTPSPVKACALQYGLPVFTPKKLREAIDVLKSFQGDVMITCAFGQILTQEILDCFPKGVWNIHAGLLPFYRGASPMQNAVKNGEEETGVSFMKTDVGLDTGDVLFVEKTKIAPLETYGELSERLSKIGAKLLIEALPKIESGDYKLTKQGEDGACVYKKIPSEAAKIDFSLTKKEIVNTIHAYNPEPIAYGFLDGVRVNFFKAEEADGNGEAGEVISASVKDGLKIACKDGAVRITEVQMSGAKKMSGVDFMNGRKATKGQRFQ